MPDERQDDVRRVQSEATQARDLSQAYDTLGDVIAHRVSQLQEDVDDLTAADDVDPSEQDRAERALQRLKDSHDRVVDRQSEQWDDVRSPSVDDA